MPSTARTVLKALAFSLAGAALVVVGVGMVLADRWQVETSRTIAAPPARVAAAVGDLSAWTRWSAWNLSVGGQTERAVEGAPGTVGQRLVWSGPHGRWALTVTALTPSSLDYAFARVVEAEHPALGGTNSGTISWVAAGDGTNVTWTDRGTWGGLLLRWFGWFGALQDRVKEMQGASLAALAAELERAPK